MAQLSTLPSQHPWSPCVYHTLSLFPSLRLQATRSLSVLLKPCLAGEGAVNSALPGVLWQAWLALGLGLQSPCSPSWSQGPYCLEAIPLPSDLSVSFIRFGLLPSYILGYC